MSIVKVTVYRKDKDEILFEVYAVPQSKIEDGTFNKSTDYYAKLETKDESFV